MPGFMSPVWTRTYRTQEAGKDLKRSRQTPLILSGTLFFLNFNHVDWLVGSLGNDFLPVEKEVILKVGTFLGRVVVDWVMCVRPYYQSSFPPCDGTTVHARAVLSRTQAFQCAYTSFEWCGSCSKHMNSIRQNIENVQIPKWRGICEINHLPYMLCTIVGGDWRLPPSNQVTPSRAVIWRIKHIRPRSGRGKGEAIQSPPVGFQPRK